MQSHRSYRHYRIDYIAQTLSLTFLCARNNHGTPDQFFKNPLRFASIGQALTSN